MNKTFAYLIIAAVLVSAFIGVFTFSMIDTDPDYGGGHRPYRSSPLAWGDVMATMAMRFELTESVQMNETQSTHHFDDDDITGIEYTLDARITADVIDVDAPALVHFEPMVIVAIRKTTIEYVADAQETLVLSPGWYKYVMTYSWDTSGGAPPGVMPLMSIAWHAGLDDTSEAGHVEEDRVYKDKDRDGQWEGEPAFGGTVAFHVVLDGCFSVAGGCVAGPDEVNETDDDNATTQVVSTVTNGDDDDRDPMEHLLPLAIGFIFLILAVIFMFSGKSSFALTAVGLALFVIGLMILAGVSFLMLAMVGVGSSQTGLLMSKPSGVKERRRIEALKSVFRPLLGMENPEGDVDEEEVRVKG